jgi:hypothetical protein
VTQENQNVRDFGIGIAAICGAFLLLIVAGLSVATRHDVEMCPTALAIALVVAVSVLSPVLAIVSMRASFRFSKGRRRPDLSTPSCSRFSVRPWRFWLPGSSST